MLMKYVSVLAFSLLTVSNAHALYCVTADGLLLEHGTTATLYYKDQPRTQIGPNYTCAVVSRARTCVDGNFSEQTPVCSQYDSGGCVDGWLAQLPDAEFNFGACLD